MFSLSRFEGVLVVLMGIWLFVRRDNIADQSAKWFGYDDVRRAQLRDVYSFIAFVMVVAGIIAASRALV